MNDAHSRYPVEEHRRFAAETRCGAVVVANILERWLDLRTVLDLGCGTGVWLRVLQGGGRRRVFGVDIEPVEPAYLEIDSDLILTADIGRKLDLHQRYDLVICLEVAEHIDAQFADVIVDNCVRHADLVLFSAALPGQQGVNHINEQPPQYWTQRFQRLDYVVLDLIRPLIWDDPQIPVWYRQNMLLLAKNGSTQLQTLRSLPEQTAGGPLAVAHPEYVRWFSTQAQTATAEAEAARQRLVQVQFEFDSSLASITRHRESEAQARTALEAALADAIRQRETESAARSAAETAAADAALRHNEEIGARAAAESAHAEAVRRVEAESAARTAAEAALDEATRQLEAVSAARAAAEAALTDAVQRLDAETAARMAVESALDEARRDLDAGSVARIATDAALADALQRLEAEAAARLATETALGEATHNGAAESAARAAAETSLADTLQQLEAETAARIAVEAALGAATQNREAEAAARAAAETALADAAVCLGAEAAARMAAEAALGDATLSREAESVARAVAEAALAHASSRCNAEATARVAAEAGLADAARHLRTAVAARDASDKILGEMRATQICAAKELRAVTSRLQLETKARVDAETALTDLARQHDENVRLRRADSAALTRARRDLAAEQIARDTAQRAHDRLSVEVATARDAARHADDLASAELASALAESAMLRWERGVILSSTSWRVTEPLRRLGRGISPSGRQQLGRLARVLAPWLRRRLDPGSDVLPEHPSEPPMVQETRSAEHYIGDLHAGGFQSGETQDGAWQSGGYRPSRSQASQLQAVQRSPDDTRAGETRVGAIRADEPWYGDPWHREPETGVDNEFEFGAGSQPEPPSGMASPPTPVWRATFISGEPHTPGHVYRVLHFAAAAAAAGTQVTCLTVPEAQTRLPEIALANMIVIWRARDSEPLRQIIAAAREGGAKLVYDVDDLMFKPELARVDIVDGIRSMRLTTEEVATHFSNIRDILVQADICTCTTEELANHMREYQKAAVVLPNGFDAETLRRARRAVRGRQAAPAEDLVRIGYATGSRTHQRDFAQVADALARVLGERSTVRLVLFRDPGSKEPVLLIDEFPALSRFAEQIEWRDMVSPELLPGELARFDINLAPVELDNVFCEAKSELKYFEAALAGVCTIASPTGPFRRAIRPGETGLLAGTPHEWYAALIALVDDAESRNSIAHAAYLDVLWRYGPEQRIDQVRSLLDQVAGGRDGARAFQLELGRRQMQATVRVVLPDSEVLFAADALGEAEVTVVIPLHNYAHYVVEALESVRAQTLTSLDLIVVDDASTDDSLDVTLEWVRLHAARFNRVIVSRNRRNAGLGITRNAGFDAAETPYVLPLDADNRLRPTCCEICLEAIRGTGAAFAYPSLQHFGDSTDVIGLEPFQPIRFVSGNYIDAMALIAKSAWAAGGGYEHIPYGWEDYELWCSFVERGLWGVHVPQLLADYRVHARSMLRTLTDERANKARVISELERRHPWLTVLDGD